MQQQIHGITIEDEDEQGNKKKVCGVGACVWTRKGSSVFTIIYK
jgi:hypothetical protein